MFKLIIVESPTKIPQIQKYVGDEYICKSTMGHFLDLRTGWIPTVDDINNIDNKYEVTKENILEDLKRICKKINSCDIYLATDKDREGEMIAWCLQKELKLKNAKRIIFTSITKKDILRAIENPSVVNMNIVYSQQTRRIIDRSSGFIVSPVLKNNIDGANSAGRVQSVVVKIIVDKENEIKEYYDKQKSTFYYINVDIEINKMDIICKLILKNDDDDLKSNESSKSNSEKKLKFDKSDEKKVLSIIKKMSKSKLSLINLFQKEKYQNPPEPFTTSTLQQSAYTYLKIDLNDTMAIAQKLYEAGFITYMRTDSTTLSDEGIDKIKNVVEKKYGIDFYNKNNYECKSDKTQEAHECIRPTQLDNEFINMGVNENKIYNLIWKRTIQSQMKPAIYQSIKIELEMLESKKLEEYKLVGFIENLIFNGFLIMDNKENNDLIKLEDLKNDIIWNKIYATEDIKSQPLRYNQASLVNKIDPKNLNIGRPATYVSLIQKIIDRKYVEIKNISGSKIEICNYKIMKDNIDEIKKEIKSLSIGKEINKFVPTKLGFDVTDFLNKNFELIMDYKFTSKMEKNLNKIAMGTKDKNEILIDFLKYLNENSMKFKKNNIILKKNIIGFYEDNIEINLLNGSNGYFVMVGNKTLSVDLFFENKKKSSNDEIVEFVKKNLPLTIGIIDEKEILLLKNKNGEYYTKIDNTIVGLNNIISDKDNIDKEFLLEYIIKNKPIYLGKINNFDVNIMSNEKGKYAYVNKIYINLNKFYEETEKIDEDEIKEYIKNYLTENINIEWKIKNKIYKIKKGHSYYLEELQDNKKLRNISLYTVLNNIKKLNNCDDLKAVKTLKKKDIENLI